MATSPKPKNPSSLSRGDYLCTPDGPSEHFVVGERLTVDMQDVLVVGVTCEYRNRTRECISSSVARSAGAAKTSI